MSVSELAELISLRLLDGTFKATAILVLVVAITPLLQKAPARTRHALWVIALFAAIVLPFSSDLVPSRSTLHLPILPSSLAPRPLEAVSWWPDIENAQALSGKTPHPSDVSAIAPGEGHEQALPIALYQEHRGRAAEEAAASPSPLFNVHDDMAPQGSSPWAITLGLWLLGVATFGGRHLLALHRVRTIRQSAEVADSEWASEILPLKERLGIDRPVDLVTGCSVRSPMTWGTKHPVVALPSQADRWSQERRRVVLLHELLHVARHDWIVRTMARAICSIYWFHPLAWLALRRLQHEQERACDEGVLAHGTRPSSYASHLLALAEGIRQKGTTLSTEVAVLEIAPRKRLEDRLMNILSPRPYRRTALTFALLALVVSLVPAIAVVLPYQGPQQTESLAPTASSSVSSPASPTPRRLIVDENGRIEQENGLAAPPPAPEPVAAPPLAPSPFPAPSAQLTTPPNPPLPPRATVAIPLYSAAPAAPSIAIAPTPVPHVSFLAQQLPDDGLEELEKRLEVLKRHAEALEGQLESPDIEIDHRLEVDLEQLEELEARMEPFTRKMEMLEQQLQPLLEDFEQSFDLAALEQDLQSQRQVLEDAVRETERGMADSLMQLDQRARALEELRGQERAELSAQERAEIQARRDQLVAESDRLRQQAAAEKDELRAHSERISREVRERARGLRSEHSERALELRQRMQPLLEEIRENQREISRAMRDFERTRYDFEAIRHQMLEWKQRNASSLRELEAVERRIEQTKRELERRHRRREATPPE